MPKSPFPKYDPERANVVITRNFHVTVILIFISILYACAAVGCIVKLASPGSNVFEGPVRGTAALTWVTWINLMLFIITIPTFLIFALKKDYLYGPWAPLKGLPLMLTALTELIVMGVQGIKWNVDWMEGVFLVIIPLCAYLLCIVLGGTRIGTKFFVPFRVEKRQRDLEWAYNIMNKPEIKGNKPIPPKKESTKA